MGASVPIASGLGGAQQLGKRRVGEPPMDSSRCPREWGWARHMEENLCEQGRSEGKQGCPAGTGG